jgi:tryptophan-rich sensory protein
MKKIIIFIACVFLPLLAGGLSGFFTAGEVMGEWYINLIKPAINPPAWVFGPVWAMLYLLMGISLYIIFTSEKSPLRTKALMLFGIQLFLNFWWSILFFSFHWLLGSIIEIIVLWSFIVAMIITFRKIKPAAAYLQIPYLFWVSFATILNMAFWWAN